MKQVFEYTEKQKILVEEWYKSRLDSNLERKKEIEEQLAKESIRIAGEFVLDETKPFHIG